MAYPQEFKYTKEHEWLAIDGTTGTVGITDHAQNSLGDIVFVELPKVGDQLTAEKPSAPWSRSRPSAIFMPRIRHRNGHQPGAGHRARESQQRAPLRLDGEAYPRQSRRTAALLSAEDYEKFIAEEK